MFKAVIKAFIDGFKEQREESVPSAIRDSGVELPEWLTQQQQSEAGHDVTCEGKDMYYFSIVHLRVTYSLSRERLLAYMKDAELDGDGVEAAAYQSVLRYGESTVPEVLKHVYKEMERFNKECTLSLLF